MKKNKNIHADWPFGQPQLAGSLSSGRCLLQQPHPAKDYWDPRQEWQELLGAAGEGLARGAYDECVNVREADIGAVEAVLFVDFFETGVVRLDEGDVDAREEGGAMQGQFDDLDGCVVAGLNVDVGGQRDLRKAHGAWVGVLGGTDDLKGRDHGQRHIHGTAVRSVVAETHVDVKKGCRMALEPTGLECDRAADDWPVCSVLGQAEAAAWIHPLHAVGKLVVCDEVVSSPSWVCDDGVGRRQQRAGDAEKC